MIQQAPREHHPVRQGIAATTAIAVAALLLVSGILTLLQGISAVVNDELLVVGPEYIFKLEHHGLGLDPHHSGCAAHPGCHRDDDGRDVGAHDGNLPGLVVDRRHVLVVALLPIWPLVVIALDIIVIWAVATWDRSS